MGSNYGRAVWTALFVVGISERYMTVYGMGVPCVCVLYSQGRQLHQHDFNSQIFSLLLSHWRLVGCRVSMTCLVFSTYRSICVTRFIQWCCPKKVLYRVSYIGLGGTSFDGHYETCWMDRHYCWWRNQHSFWDLSRVSATVCDVENTCLVVATPCLPSHSITVSNLSGVQFAITILKQNWRLGRSRAHINSQCISLELSGLSTQWTN